MTDYATMIENLLSARELHSGRFDLLWSRLEAHRIDERDPGDGTRIPEADLKGIWEWLARQTPDALRYWEKH
jgi:hypothetical protein